MTFSQDSREDAEYKRIIESRHQYLEIQEEIARALKRIKRGVDDVELALLKSNDAVTKGLRSICMGIETVKNAQDRLNQKLLEKRNQ